MTDKPDGEVDHALQENDAVTHGGQESFLYNRDVQAWVRKAANRGIYDIRGMGAKRKVPHFDDLVFLTASASRYPLEGYRERCETRTVLGSRNAKRPLELDTPITIAGMSFGSLSANVKEALGRGASAVGTSTRTRSAGRPRCWSTSVCPRATASTRTICAGPTLSRWSSARGPSLAAGACCSGRRSASASPP
jgi:hypothetical protein